MLKSLELSGAQVGLLTLLLFLITAAIIFIFRSYFKRHGQEELTAKYAGKTWSSPLKARTKYPEVNQFSFTGPLLRYGLAAALATTLFAFSWTQREAKIFIPDNALALDTEIEVEPPRTAEPPPPPPPPPPPVIEEVPDEVEIEQPKLQSTEVEKEEIIETPKEVAKENTPPPPPPPPPPAPKEEAIFVKAEQMPRFPGCEDMSGTNEEKAKCAEGKLIAYIYSNIKYPAIARENGVEGTAVVKFVVDTDGSITGIELLKDPGVGLGDAAKDVVDSMNRMSSKWTPGKQSGRPVKVYYTLPVKFKLQ